MASMGTVKPIFRHFLPKFYDNNSNIAVFAYCIETSMTIKQNIFSPSLIINFYI